MFVERCVHGDCELRSDSRVQKREADICCSCVKRRFRFHRFKRRVKLFWTQSTRVRQHVRPCRLLAARALPLGGHVNPHAVGSGVDGPLHRGSAPARAAAAVGSLGHRSWRGHSSNARRRRGQRLAWCRAELYCKQAANGARESCGHATKGSCAICCELRAPVSAE